MGEEDAKALLSCLGASTASYGKGEFVLRQGECTHKIFLLIKGSLHIQKDDYWGNRSILGRIEEGEMFGEAYAAPESGPMMNDVVALEDSTVLSFEVGRLLTSCPNACSYHTAVIRNLFFAISEKNRKLVQKLGHMSRRSTREKLLSFLSEEAKRHGRNEFTIPFNRQQLADFLSVDRSAMSSELCKLRDEGFLHFQKSRFQLLSASAGSLSIEKAEEGDHKTNNADAR